MDLRVRQDHNLAFVRVIEPGEDLLELVRPDIYAKGGDYTPQMLPETPVVERLGGQGRILSYLSDHSTTAIVARIRRGATTP